MRRGGGATGATPARARTRAAPNGSRQALHPPVRASQRAERRMAAPAASVLSVAALASMTGQRGVAAQSAGAFARAR